MPSQPSTPLEELAALWSLRDNDPTAEQAAHLRLVVQQRTIALLRLERTTRQSGLAQREQLAPFVEHLKRAVEAELALECAEADGRGSATGREGKGKSESTRLARERAEEALVDCYASVMRAFDGAWAAGERLFARWDVALPVSDGRVRSWLDQVDPGGTAQEVLAALLKDPYVLGSGIAALDPLGALVSPPAGSSAAAPPAPLAALLIFVNASLGPHATLELCLGMFHSAVLELVGRELSASNPSSSSSSEDGLGLGLGLGLGIELEDGAPAHETRRGGRTAREKDIEEFLVGVLDALEALGETAGDDSFSASAHAAGQLAFEQRGIEDLLLSFIARASQLRHNEPPDAPITASPPPPYSPARSASSWSSTLTSGFSTLASYPSAAMSTAVGVATGALPFGLPSPSLSQAGTSHISDVHPRDTASPPGPSTPSPPTAPAFPPYSPDAASKPLPRWPVQAFSTLLTETATSLLRLLTPSATARQPSLPEALVSRLLSSTFPASSSTAEHGKVLLLAVVRWWGFKLLGRVLRSPATAAAPSPTSGGVEVETSADAPQRRARDNSHAVPLLDEVFVPTADELEYLVPLHREVYCALVDVCGVGASSETAGKAGSGGAQEPEKVALLEAARALIAVWSNPQDRPAPSSATHGCRAAGLAPSELTSIIDAFGSVILPASPRPFGTHSPTGGSSGSFKRSPAFGAGDKAPSSSEVTHEHRETSLTERAAELADRASALPPAHEGVAGLAVFYVATGVAGREPVVGLEPPSPSSPSSASFAPSLAASSADAATVCRATCALLARGGSPLNDELGASLGQAASAALAAKDYPSHVLFAQAHTLVISSPSLAAAVVEELASPLRAVRASALDEISLAHAQLASLEAQRRSIASLARGELERSEALRRRAWHLTVVASPLGVQLRTRLRQALDPHRPIEELELARSELDEWRAELGVVDVLKVDEADVGLDEALMLVEVTTALATEPRALLAHPLFHREGQTLARAFSAAGEGGPEAVKSITTSILSAPAALWSSLPLPTPASSAAVDKGRSVYPAAEDGSVEYALSSSGASPGSLVAGGRIDAPTYIEQLSYSLAGYLFSDLSSPASITSRTTSSPLIPLRDDFGTDGWLSRSLSSMPHLTRTGVGTVACSRSPSVVAPGSFVAELLRRIVLHPSPGKKVDAMLDLVIVLSSAPEPQIVAEPAVTGSERPLGHKAGVPSLHLRTRSSSRRKLSLHRHFRSRTMSTASEQTPISPATSAISAPDFAPRGSSPGHAEPSMVDSLARRRRCRRTSLPAAFDVQPEEAMLGIPPGESDGAAELSSHSLATTDELLNRLESALLQQLPALRIDCAHGLFLSLHIVTSLLPSLLTSPSSHAKALSDLLVAALSIKRDALAGKDGIVERAWDALSEGREEGIALARSFCGIALREDSRAARDLAVALT